ncbi:hypothetical protein KY290_032387 [Solanum tuberosum]|uniref:Cytochrome P450 n=1 Tax=Solanum tuberosum TaxID=4113 RepID=A0ABQ7UDM8_SOLTU|nr:hypothetical protein KY290_032387 [Solanum tuberosum]
MFWYVKMELVLVSGYHNGAKALSSLYLSTSIMNTIVAISLFLLPVFCLLARRIRSSKRVPPGSLGFPVIGQSLGLLRAMKANTAEKWLDERVQKYGPISKLSLFGKPTVFIYGQAANKFLFTSDGSVLTSKQPQSLKMILGDRCLLEMNDEDHKRVRDTLVSFLKPDSLKRYVGKMDEEVRIHLETYWKDEQIIKVLPLMKTLTFDIICSLLFGLERGARRDQMLHPTRTSSSLLSIRGENKQELMSENEIIHNVMLIMVAGYATSSILITFMVRLLAKNPNIHAAVLEEQEEIAQNKSPGESLTWEDLGNMKYTWRVAMETMRMFPPIFGGFRQTVKDIEYGGYLIPKGWQIFLVTAKTHMDSSIFQELEKFDPARFENTASLPPYNFVPFGGGARICPGYEFAKVETLVTIHYLVTHITWKLCCTDDFFSRDPTPVPTQGLPIQIIPRKPL